MRYRWMFAACFVLMLTACHLPNRTTNTPLATPVIAAPSTTFVTPGLIPIETLLARATATFVPTSTPRALIASALDQPVNCRYGPSTAYAVVGGLDVGGRAEIIGKNIDATWWVVKNPSDPSTTCWLVASLVNAVGNLDALPVMNAPLAQVSNIQIQVNPPSMNVSCNSFPQYITVTAEITVNGPTTVTWRWETSEGEVFDKDPLLYLESGSQSVLLYYKIASARDYWIQARALTPNDAAGRAIFKATCVP